MDNEALIAEFAARTDAATIAMLASTSDRRFFDAESVIRAFVTVIFGTVRNSFERGHPEQEVNELRRHLIAMCRAYLESCVG